MRLLNSTSSRYGRTFPRDLIVRYRSTGSDLWFGVCKKGQPNTRVQRARRKRRTGSCRRRRRPRRPRCRAGRRWPPRGSEPVSTACCLVWCGVGSPALARSAEISEGPRRYWDASRSPWKCPWRSAPAGRLMMRLLTPPGLTLGSPSLSGGDSRRSSASGSGRRQAGRRAA